jgi:hypothetical protein
LIEIMRGLNSSARILTTTAAVLKRPCGLNDSAKPLTAKLADSDCSRPWA